jgi:hypothetical protein
LFVYASVRVIDACDGPAVTIGCLLSASPRELGGVSRVLNVHLQA